MQPLERQLKLIAFLLTAPRPQTFEEIRVAIGAYDQDDAGAAKRQFERDKDDLRGIGIPLETGHTDIWEVEQGYSIDREAYALPEITFTEEEVAALYLAAYAPGDDGGAAIQAFGKLAHGLDSAVLGDLPEHVPTAVEMASPHLREVAAATRARALLRFTYRGTDGVESDREVDPWGLVFWGGNWYLVGRDRGADDVRAFRLSRVVGEPEEAGDAEPPPEGFRASEHMKVARPWGFGDPELTARMAFGPQVASWAISQAPGARILATRAPDGWTEAEVPASGGDTFVSWVLGFGDQAEVLDPPEVREAVREALEAVRATV